MMADVCSCEGFRTWYDVRLESVTRFKADLGERKQGSASRSRPAYLGRIVAAGDGERTTQGLRGPGCTDEETRYCLDNATVVVPH
jgi:hypothetical protein